LVEHWLLSRAGQLVGIDDVQWLLDRIARSQPALVRETVPKMIPLAEFKELLCELLREGMSLDHAAQVLEALACEPKGVDTDDLVDRIRRRLAPLITAGLKKGGRDIPALELDDDMVSVLTSSLNRTARGKRLALPIDVLDRIVRASQKAVENVSDPVLLVPSELRRPLAALLAPELPQLTVVAHDEIEPSAPMEIVGQISV
jgi:flagellar biosynthesis protein FlhA